MRPALLAAAISLLAACTEAPPPVAPPPPPPPTAAVAAPAPTVTASAEPAAPPRLPARLGAPIDGRLAEVVVCKPESMMNLQTWPIGKQVLGLCGFAVQSSAVFAVPESGPARLAPQVFKDVPMGSTQEGLYGIFDVTGPDLDHLDARLSTLMSRTGVSYRFRKQGKQWKKIGTQPFEGSDWYCSAGCIEIANRALVEQWAQGRASLFRYLDERPGWLPARAKVPGCDEEVHAFGLLFSRGKELWGVGSACDKAATQRWTIGGTDTTAERLDLPAREQVYARLQDIGGGRELYVGGFNDLALFDGKRWTALATFGRDQGTDVLKGGGKVWIKAGKTLHRLEDARLVEVPVPDDGIEIVTLSPKGEMRVWTGKGLYALEGDDLWHPITLPPGMAKVESLTVVGERWSLRTAPSDNEWHLLVEGASGPPLRIDEPPAAISPIAYVRPLTASCEKPFAMLYKLAKTAPKDYDFPATKKALAGHPALQAGKFSEIAALGDRYLVVQFPGKQARQQLGEVARLVEKNVQGSKPQLLCADGVPDGLPTTRDVSMR